MFGRNTAEYRGWIERKKEMDNMPEHLQVVNTGSTSGYQAFDYKYWDVPGANLGSQPQTLYYDFEMLKRYSTHIDKGARVYICVEGFKFLVDKYSAVSANFKYYFYLDKEQILGYDNWTKKQLFYFPFIAKNRLIWQEGISIAKKILAYKSKKTEFKSQKEKDQYYADLYLEGWYNGFGWLKEGEELKTQQKEAIKLNFIRLKEMLFYCEEHEWRPIIVIIPFSPHISRRLPANILEDCLWRPLREIEQLGYQVIELFNDEELSDYHLYEDAISFNDEGRNIFNRKIQMLSEKIMGEEEKDPHMKENLKNNREEENKRYCLRNGLTIPWISFGTGVIWKYTRNKVLFLKVNMKEILSSFKHLRLNRELKGNLQINKILRDAYDAGFRLFDTGRIYAFSEISIGKNVAFHPDVFIATKCSAMDITRKNSPYDVVGNLKISLNYLKRDKADLYLLHWPEGDWLNYYSQIIEQYKKGNCKAFGVCNLNLTHLKEIERAGLELPLIIQTELHPFNVKEELREYCREHNIQLMAHTPTARSKAELLKNPIVKSLMEKYNKSAVQIILRWHYQHNVIPVVSTFNKKHMIENHKIFDFLLTDSEINEIDSLNQDFIVLDSTGIDDPNYIYNI